MTTPHIGDEDGIVTADHADDETEQPEQAAQAENTAPPDPADEAEPDEVEQDEVPREMERSLSAPTASTLMRLICTASGNTGVARLRSTL